MIENQADTMMMLLNHAHTLIGNKMGRGLCRLSFPAVGWTGPDEVTNTFMPQCDNW